jgi:hypothetical protein
MFDFKKAMQSLENRSYSLVELVNELERIQAEYIGKIPPEFRSRELLELARKLGWIQDEANGMILVSVPSDQAEAEQLKAA